MPKLIIILFLFIFPNNIYSQENIRLHYVGEKYGGGIIFHLWEDSNNIQHGLILSPVTIGTTVSSDGRDIRYNNAEWSNIINKRVNNSIMGTDGNENCEQILRQKGHIKSAAKLCLDFYYNNFNDWYLPSIEECKLLINVRDIINFSLYDFEDEKMVRQSFYFVSSSSVNCYGEYFEDPGEYWTSTEIDESKAYAINLATGNIYKRSKDYLHALRPIRKF